MEIVHVSAKGIGQALRDIRKAKGLTQTEVGRRVGLDQQKVSLLENGNSGSRIDTLFRLLSALDVGLVVQPKIDYSIENPDQW